MEEIKCECCGTELGEEVLHDAFDLETKEQVDIDFHICQECYYNIPASIVDNVAILKQKLAKTEAELDDKNIMYWDMVDSLELERNKPIKIKIIDSIINYLKE